MSLCIHTYLGSKQKYGKSYYEENAIYARLPFQNDTGVNTM